MNLLVFRIKPYDSLTIFFNNSIRESRFHWNSIDKGLALNVRYYFFWIHSHKFIYCFYQYVCQNAFLTKQSFRSFVILCIFISYKNCILRFCIHWHYSFSGIFKNSLPNIVILYSNSASVTTANFSQFHRCL